MSDDDSRRLLRLFGPVLAREAAQLRRRRRMRALVAALVAIVLLGVGWWLGLARP